MKGLLKVVGNFIYILKLAWKESKGLLFIECALNIIRGPALLFIVYLEKIIIDNLVPEQKNIESSFEKLLIIILLTILTKIIYEFLMTLDTKLFIQTSYKLYRQVILKTLHKIKDIDKRHFDNPEVKNIIYRGFSFSENLNSLISSLMILLRTFVTFIASLIILLNYNKLYIIIAIIIYIPKLLANKYQISQNIDLQKEITEVKRKKDYYSSVLSSSKYAKEIRLFGSGNFFIQKYKQESDKHYRLEKKVLSKMLMFNLLTQFLYNIFDSLIYGYLIYMAFNSKITIGEVTFIYAAFTNFSQELSMSIASIMEIYKAIVTYEFFYKLMSIDNKIIKNQKEKGINNVFLNKNNGQHSIEFVNVSFSYPNSGKKILENVSFKINAGETIAIVGKNGSGKSTIIKLLLRLYDCDQGYILIDNIDIREYEPKELYKQWGVLFQDYNIYSIKLKEAIAFGEKEENYDKNKMEYALQKSGLGNYKELFTNSLETPITRLFNKNGYIPSGGQAQKLSLTKVFYFDTEMLILDEPSAAIDAKAEQYIFKSMESIANNKTCILISHRLSNVIDASNILVLDNGNIVESGTHLELINNGGLYCNLFKIQSEHFS